MTGNNVIDIGAWMSSKVDEIKAEAEGTLKGGGGGGTFNDMEARVTALEALAKQTNEKLDKLIDKASRIEVDVARLDGKVTALPKAEDFGHLRGRVDSLPTIPKIAGLMAIAVAVITLVNNWETVKAFFH